MIFEEFVIVGLVGCAMLFCVFLQMGYIDSLYEVFRSSHEVKCNCPDWEKCRFMIYDIEMRKKCHYGSEVKENHDLEEKAN